MCEVVRNNFSEFYPQIIENLHSASFIAIDCEFSGLSDREGKSSLFDTPEARFRKLLNSTDNFLIIQFGLSTFKYESFENVFSVSSYSFYIMPSSYLNENLKFSSQVQSLQFLCRHNFDYNKLFYEGIHYINKFDEEEVLKMLKNDSFIINEFEQELQKYCFNVMNWSSRAEDDSNMLLDLYEKEEVFVYCLHRQIRKMGVNVWTYYEQEKIICVKKVTPSQKTELLSNKEEELILNKKMIESLLGFSKIMKELENLKKPIIGHNILLDMVMIYHQFFNPFPVSYKKFKSEVNKIFPHIYDTKHMSFRLRDISTKENLWISNALTDLYEYLRNGKGSTLAIFTPRIKHKNKSFTDSEQFHEAGFDSYISGFCFIKMAHAYSLWDPQNKKLGQTSLKITSTWLLKAVSGMENHLNFPRGQVNYIVLNGPDPKKCRPDFLLFESKDKQPIDISQISNAVAKYALVDIHRINKFKALMAVSNHFQVKNILENYKDHKTIKVTKYNSIKYSHFSKFFLVGITIAVTALFPVLYLKHQK